MYLSQYVFMLNKILSESESESESHGRVIDCLLWGLWRKLECTDVILDGTFLTLVMFYELLDGFSAQNTTYVFMVFPIIHCCLDASLFRILHIDTGQYQFNDSVVILPF